MDRISTNMICERAGVTPPALYYYFCDKYEVIAALGERLMDRQNHVLTSWLAQHAPGGLAAYGWSYGGYMSLKLLEKAPGVFSAAVAGAPVKNGRAHV